MDPIKVIIKEREINWISDYPEGWQFSAGDPYKFPVVIGDNTCFVKRFMQTGPENISGWNLLIKMRGKFEKNLSRIYDLKRVDEDGDEVYYGFYEWLEGTTLDNHLNGTEIDLKHLSADLFSAMRTLQKYEFWFPDFTEKNIFCEKNGIFALVDTDSAHPASDAPDNEMYGSKDYWVLVFSYYKNILGKNQIRLSDIHGINLNYLQIPFLLLRLKLFQSGRNKNYNSPEFFNGLPDSLNEIAPELKEIFLLVIDKGREPLSAEEVNKISDIVEKKIIKNPEIKEVMVAQTNLPVIKEFSVSNTTIGVGGSFTLSWQVENADRLELFKNGARFRELSVDQKNLTLTDFADGTREQSAYQLIAYKGSSIAKSDSVTIKQKKADTKDPKQNRTMWYIISAVIIALVAFGIYKLTSSSKPTSPDPVQPAGITINLIDSASRAKWITGLNISGGDSIDPINRNVQTDWPGSETNFKGYAKTGTFIMEDSQSYFLLRMHPWWLPNGTVRGGFPWCTVPGKKHFTARVGFVKDLATGQKSTDGVTFQGWLHYQVNGDEKAEKIFSQHKDYDEKLMDIRADFPPDTPDNFFIELRVDAGNASNVDWAAWVNPVVTNQ